jgi:hypothetical protein
MLLGCVAFFGYGYMYDFPTLFLFSLGLLLMVCEKRFWFLVVFTFGTLNKETAIFLTLIFGLYFFRGLPGRRFVALLASQLGVYGIIQGVIRFTYRNNPGQVMEWHFPEQLPAYESVARDTPFLLVTWGVVCILVVILVLHRWSDKPLFVRVAFAIFPIFLALFVFWGYPLEIRSMLEVFPILAILVLPPPRAMQPAPLALRLDADGTAIGPPGGT